MKRAEGKAVIDYAFHMIVRELSDQVSIDMDRMVRHDGVTSFKLFMAYPGVFMVDDATIFKALLKTRENGGLICMHAENGGVIDTLVKEALRKGETRAEVSRADAADARRGRSHRPRHRARGDGGRADLHRASVVRGRAREGASRRATWGCRRTPRPARSICSSPTTTTSARASRARSS